MLFGLPNIAKIRFGTVYCIEHPPEEESATRVVQKRCHGRSWNGDTTHTHTHQQQQQQLDTNLRSSRIIVQDLLGQLAENKFLSVNVTVIHGNGSKNINKTIINIHIHIHYI